MTLEKLAKIISALKLSRQKLNVCHLIANGNGELILELNTQAEREMHAWLLHKGFVEDDDGDYIYRPYRRPPHRAPADMPRHSNVVPFRRR